MVCMGPQSMKPKSTMSTWSPMYGYPFRCVVEKALTEQVLAQAKSDESERALAEIGCKFKSNH
jgi:hypothetical protein